MARLFPVSGKIIFVSLVVLIAGGIAAASGAGWIDLRAEIGKVPVVGRMISSDSSKDKTVAPEKEIGALEAENKKLKARIAQLEKEANLLRELTLQSDQQGRGANLQEGSGQGLGEKEPGRDLAAYYSEMKPGASAAIMKNLDSQLVADILRMMDKEQAGQILAAMDPAEAAAIMGLIAEKAAQTGNLAQ